MSDIFSYTPLLVWEGYSFDFVVIHIFTMMAATLYVFCR